MSSNLGNHYPRCSDSCQLCIPYYISTQTLCYPWKSPRQIIFGVLFSTSQRRRTTQTIGTPTLKRLYQAHNGTVTPKSTGSRRAKDVENVGQVEQGLLHEPASVPRKAAIDVVVRAGRRVKSLLALNHGIFPDPIAESLACGKRVGKRQCEEGRLETDNICFILIGVKKTNLEDCFQETSNLQENAGTEAAMMKASIQYTGIRKAHHIFPLRVVRGGNPSSSWKTSM